MTSANFMLKATEKQYRHVMDKTMKNKYKPVPKMVEMFNFKSDQSNQGYGFIYYKNLIQQAWHPTALFVGQRVIVWDVAFMCCDFLDNRFELHICNRLDREENTTFKFKSDHERACFMDHILVEFNKNNKMISIIVPKSHLWAANYGQILRKFQLETELKSL